jgi:hypothetical protein
MLLSALPGSVLAMMMVVVPRMEWHHAQIPASQPDPVTERAIVKVGVVAGSTAAEKRRRHRYRYHCRCQ